MQSELQPLSESTITQHSVDCCTGNNPLTPTVAVWVLSIRVSRCQKLKMMASTGLGTVCFTAVPIWQQWASKG